MNRDLTVEMTQKHYDQVFANACLYNKTDTPTLAMIKRCECELYELHMMDIGRWQDFDGWAIDGISDQYGKVDVKTINGDKPWWNISAARMRNICRQFDVIDNYYFIKQTNVKSERMEVGETAEYKFLGVASYKQVMKQIQTSYGNGFYFDTRKATLK